MSRGMRRIAGVTMVGVGLVVCVTVGLPGVLLMLYGIVHATDERPASIRGRGKGW